MPIPLLIFGKDALSLLSPDKLAELIDCRFQCCECFTPKSLPAENGGHAGHPPPTSRGEPGERLDAVPVHPIGMGELQVPGQIVGTLRCSRFGNPANDSGPDGNSRLAAIDVRGDSGAPHQFQFALGIAELPDSSQRGAGPFHDRFGRLLQTGLRFGRLCQGASEVCME